METTPASLETTIRLPGRRGRNAALPVIVPRTHARRGPLEIRTDGGWTFQVPLPAAILGGVGLLLAVGLACFDPSVVKGALLERHASQLARWDAAEQTSVARSLAEVEGPLRDLRRQALLLGIPPEGELAPSSCEGAPFDHLEGHLREVSRLAAALASRGPALRAEASSLPSRSPIDLSAGDYVLTTAADGEVHLSSHKGGRTDPFTGLWKEHKGLDIAAPVGTAVVAPGDGTLIFPGSVDPNVDHARSMLGSYVEISHGSTGYRSIYGHLSRIDVKAGQHVLTGQLLGAVGTSGHSTAPHLHYQLMKGDQAVDPLSFITDAVLVKDGRSVWYARKEQARR